MQQQKVHYPLGAHLIVKHFGYTHHGIYAGRGRVIHYSGFAHLFKKHPIEITSIENFSHGRKITVNQYQDPKYKGRKVVRRMRSRMHENNYHLIINNCEHLCTWAITGVESSPQVIKNDEQTYYYWLCQLYDEFHEQSNVNAHHHLFCLGALYQKEIT